MLLLSGNFGGSMPLLIRKLWPAIALLALVWGFALGAAPFAIVSGNHALRFEVAAPGLYVLFSPISRTLDGLTLLSVPQTIALWITVAIVTLLVKPRTQWKPIAKRLGILILAIAVLEAAVAYAPRPMLALSAKNPDDVLVDFHSHTGFSHDVRKSFTVADALAWHRGGGFDIAWITDHVKFDAERFLPAVNPPRAGMGTSLLVGVEGRYHKIMSTIMLGLDSRDTALLNKRGNLLPGQPARGRAPVTIVATPNRNLDSVTVQSLDSLPHFVALELIDAAPRGLGQFDRDEAKLRRMADSLNFTLVAASNNHGFGRAVAAWNAVTLPGWRSMSPDSAGSAIEDLLRNHRRDAVTIVARNRPHTHGATLVLTLPVFLYSITAGMGGMEAIAWTAWIVVAAISWIAYRPNAEED
jgi:hypothetical protein